MYSVVLLFSLAAANSVCLDKLGACGGPPSRSTQCPMVSCEETCRSVSTCDRVRLGEGVTVLNHPREPKTGNTELEPGSDRIDLWKWLANHVLDSSTLAWVLPSRSSLKGGCE